ncbi:S1 family peptidase [Chryseolinea lacunae]|uniref:Trypsin-like peptidase domain-containing protein n=1 Tax=Chryseolinea lacunae TaxID=2801331 RepID=A0ABS1L1Y3_9BACT|nr:serine protease [Chryseolinea lacunae]MBL0745580.1 trypsin-like peptidase domain-containing protein [Chryseolinea lacunae]
MNYAKIVQEKFNNARQICRVIQKGFYAIVIIFERVEPLDEVIGILKSRTPETRFEVQVAGTPECAELNFNFPDGEQARIFVGDKFEEWLDEILLKDQNAKISILAGYKKDGRYDYFINWPNIQLNAKRARSFEQLSTLDPSLHSVIAISAVEQQSFWPFGSGVMLMEGYAATARHNIIGLYNHYNDYRKIGNDVTGTVTIRGVGLVAVHNYGNGDVPALWTIESAHFDALSDVAILRLSPRNDVAEKYHWKGCPKLNINPPRLNEVISAFGFTTFDESEFKSNLDHVILNFISKDQYDLWAAVKAKGVVLNIFSKHRDRGMVSFPCFKTDADFKHGMSGGPIFDSNGNLVGIISQGSVPIALGETESFGALLWPLLRIVVSIEGKTRFLDILKESPVEVIGIENLVLNADGSFDFRTIIRGF